jgi:hypothetical protein
MRNFQAKNKQIPFYYSKPFLIFLFLIVLFFFWQMFVFLKKAQMTHKNKKLAEDKYMELMKKKEELSNSVEALHTAEGKESFVRENYGLVREGENIVILVTETKEDSVQTEGDVKSFFRNIINKD